ncbi:type VII secretion integral membrane protein EccD [Agrococcus baldri]|uniref:EccD-like transmembrane domain-containing protein n=1 Tax=Agrococcus baldri TaxID=153730 RepID=A0AA87RJD9_9MICO|nr:type VII secretion integral membrane protein EccD [Agrococcus baldri]GEK81474.1 hypothetical protein ABA31_28250 [Agrococcus baldri]
MEYTRLSIQGSTRRADIVVPDDEPVEALMPEILELLEEPAAGARPVVLTTLTGEQIDASLTLDEQAVGHGTRLRVVAVDEAPPPPDVAEVTEAVGEVTASRPNRWSTRHAATAAALPLLVLSSLGTTAAGDGGWLAPWGAGMLAMVLVAAAVLLARTDRTAAAIAATAVAAGVAERAAAAALAGDGHWAQGALASAAAIALVIGLVAQIGFGSRGIALGTGLVVAACGAAGILQSLGMHPSDVAAVVGLVSAVLLGLLPGIALSTSGLTSFDDRVVAGGRVSRADVRTSIETAFLGLTAMVAAAAATAAAAGTVLVLEASTWAVLLALVIAAIVALRARMLPLGPQRLVVLLAATVPVILWIATSPMLEGAWRPAVAAAAALLVVAVLALRPSAPALARRRRWAGVLEFLAVLAAITLLLGKLGVLADLTETFG